MDTSRLEHLGLRVKHGPDGSVLATLELGEGSILENPITRQPISHVTFQLAGDRLLPSAPPAVAGMNPILLGSVAFPADIALLISSAFDDYLFHIERRSAQLHAMGLHPHLDPETLELSFEMEAGLLSLMLMADRMGQFRVARVLREGREIIGLPPFRFELFEFRDRESLASYLSTLIEERLARPASVAVGTGAMVRYEEVVGAFGPQAVVPPRSTLEVLVELRVKGERYRFAAGRVMGRTFRGLLAGAKGKIWADRFELDGFPGIVPLVAQQLGVSPGEVLLVSSDSSQE
jgi:hypothetical protein